jgi:hypothetical protein
MENVIIGSIWRTEIAGAQENAREIKNVTEDGIVFFTLRAPPGPEIVGETPIVQQSREEWLAWVKTWNAKPIKQDEMKKPPAGMEPNG